MDFKREKLFFKISFPLKRSEVYLEPTFDYDDRELKASTIFRKPPWQVEIVEGKKFYDIVRLADPMNFSISEKVLHMLKESKFTGWKTFPLVISKSDKKYHVFQATGRCGKIGKPEKPGFTKGITFDLQAWDGSDFFQTEDTSFLFCTERASRFFQKNKVTNIKFTDIRDVRWYCPERLINDWH